MLHFFEIILCKYVVAAKPRYFIPENVTVAQDLKTACSSRTSSNMSCECGSGLAQALQHIEDMRSDQGQKVDEHQAVLNAMFSHDSEVDKETSKQTASLRAAQASYQGCYKRSITMFGRKCVAVKVQRVCVRQHTLYPTQMLMTHVHARVARHM
jgi:hypothetical protein